MAKCLYCGEPLKTFSMEFIDEIHPECNEKYQKEVNEAREEVNEAREEVKEDRDTQVKDALLYSNSQSNSKYSLNAYLADTTITFFNIFFFIFVALLIYISYKIGQWLGGGFGFDVADTFVANRHSCQSSEHSGAFCRSELTHVCRA